MSEGFLPTQDSRAGQRQPGTARVPSSQRRLRPHGSSVRAGPQPHGRAPEPRPAARGGQCVLVSHCAPTRNTDFARGRAGHRGRDVCANHV